MVDDKKQVVTPPSQLDLGRERRRNNTLKSQLADEKARSFVAKRALETLNRLCQEGWQISLTMTYHQDGADVFGFTVEGGDINCHHTKPYDPEDGHGHTLIRMTQDDEKHPVNDPERAQEIGPDARWPLEDAVEYIASIVKAATGK